MPRLNTPCREWQGSRTIPQGYGQKRVNGRLWRVHRWVMAQVHGEDAIRGKVVMHLCDNPPCFRYDHLVIGTQSENILDAYAKGRKTPSRIAPKGEQNGHAKLTEADVRAIRTDVTRTQRAIAAEYWVAQSTISRIKQGYRWGEVV